MLSRYAPTLRLGRAVPGHSVPQRERTLPRGGQVIRSALRVNPDGRTAPFGKVSLCLDCPLRDHAGAWGSLTSGALIAALGETRPSLPVNALAAKLYRAACSAFSEGRSPSPRGHKAKARPTKSTAVSSKKSADCLNHAMAGTAHARATPRKQS